MGIAQTGITRKGTAYLEGGRGITGRLETHPAMLNCLKKLAEWAVTVELGNWFQNLLTSFQKDYRVDF